MLTYLILGNGFLGNKFANYFPDSELSDMRVNSLSSAISIMESYNPKIVINCIGKTGFPNVDWCDKNKIPTLESNVLVPTYLAIACQNLNIKLVHISSGCIYEGSNRDKGFYEDSEPNFFGSYYSRTKILSEKILDDFNILQLRIRMPIDSVPDDRNLVTKLLKYEKIMDADNSVTIISDFLTLSKKLIDNQLGKYNVVNSGIIKNSEILEMYQEVSGKTLEYSVISPKQLDKLTLARRSNCLLSTDKLKKEGYLVPDVKSSLRNIIIKYVELEDKYIG